jgi:DNA helicase-2/ATP-dependent DNA helicase PcrA
LSVLIDISVPSRAGGDWTAFVKAVARLRASRWLADLELAGIWYQPHLERIPLAHAREVAIED